MTSPRQRRRIMNKRGVPNVVSRPISAKSEPPKKTTKSTSVTVRTKSKPKKGCNTCSRNKPK